MPTNWNKMIHRALDVTTHGVYVTDTRGRFEFVNAGFRNITGYTETELLETDTSILNSGRMPSEYFARLWSTILQGETWQEEVINRRSDGSEYRAFQIISPVTNDAGEITHFIGIQNDITDAYEVRRSRDKLLAEKEAVFANTQDALFLIDVESGPVFRYRQLNPTHEAVSGLTTEGVRGRTPRQVLPPGLARQVEANYRRCLEAGETISYEEELRLPGGTRVWNTRLTPVYQDGRIAQIVGSGRDITDRREMEEELRYLSEMDALTGIANRRKIRDELEREIARAIRHDHDLSLVMMDIDHFKHINDSYGHETGDAVLRSISTTVEAILRPSDRLGRWGGDEFVIILPETKPTGAVTLAQRALEAIRNSRAVPGHQLSASMGISGLFRESGDDAGIRHSIDSLVRRADEELYQAKEAGRNRICVTRDDTK